MASDPDRFVTDLMPPEPGAGGPLRGTARGEALEALKDKVRWALVERTQVPPLICGHALPRVFALGELGDPRFVRRHGPYGALPAAPLIDIPGGTYRIGGDEGLYESRAPVHDVELQSFSIAHFPRDQCGVGVVHADRG